jgi:hypothetical protein
VVLDNSWPCATLINDGVFAKNSGNPAGLDHGDHNPFRRRSQIRVRLRRSSRPAVSVRRAGGRGQMLLLPTKWHAMPDQRNQDLLRCSPHFLGGRTECKSNTWSRLHKDRRSSQPNLPQEYQPSEKRQFQPIAHPSGFAKLVLLGTCDCQSPSSLLAGSRTTSDR